MGRSAILNVMVQAAFKAGRELRRDFGEIENLQILKKGPADFVSAADKKSEKTIFESLKIARPDYGFLMEESGELTGKDKQHRWIIDPLDGTTNFLHGIPIFAISIALERQGILTAGVIYNPITNELFTAERGIGAYFNDHRLRVSGRRNLSDCVLGTGIPHLGREKHKKYLDEIAKIMKEVSGIRRFGAASLDLAYVASGRLDGFWEYGLNYWDIAAGMIMVREAGGFVSTPMEDKIEEKSKLTVAGNDHVFRSLISILGGTQK